MQPPPSNAAEPAPPGVAVVLHTAGDAAQLAACLGAVLAQRVDPALFEVVVVDGAPGPGDARAVVRALAPCGGAPAVHYVEVDANGGPEVALRAAARVARAPTVLLIDDTARPEPDWLLQQTVMPRQQPSGSGAQPAAAR